MTRRIERVNSLIRQEISELLRSQVKDPRLGTSVTGAEGDRQETLGVLTAASGFFRNELAKRLKLRRVPELSFQWDDSIERGAHLLELIDRISTDKDS